MKKKLLMLLCCCFLAPSLQAQVHVQDSLYLDSIMNRWQLNLNEITISTNQPVTQYGNDMVEYRVEDDVESKTQNLLDMLRKVPMVTVDGRNNITVNGSSEFLVYIDGRYSNVVTSNPAKLLRGMSAANVQRIEIITHPGAKYDAEGVGGIINIITKKANRLHFSELSGNTHTTIGNSRWGEDFMLNYANKSWTVDFSVMTEYEYQRHSPISIDILHKSTPFATEYRESSFQDTRQHMPFAMSELNVGYQIDSLSALHLSLSGSYMGMIEKGKPQYSFEGGNFPTRIDLLAKSLSKFHQSGFDGSIDYQRFFGKNEDGSMTFTYQYSSVPTYITTSRRYDSPDLSAQWGFHDIDILSKEHSNSHRVLADFEIPIWDWFQLNTGGKYVGEINRSEIFRQTRSMLAAYAEGEFSVKWLTAKGGVRYEYVWQRSHNSTDVQEDFSKNGGIWVPSASVTFQIGKHQQLGGHYQMRIRRPGIEELNPFVNTYDPFSITYGNPHLNMEKTHLADLCYMLNLKKISLSAKLQHSITRNGIQSYTFLQDNQLHSTYGNIAHSNRSTAYLSFSACLTSSTRLMLNSEVSYVSLTSETLHAHNQGWNLNGNLCLQQNLPWKLKMSLSLEYMSKEYTLQGWESGMSEISASISRSFLEDKWNVAISMGSALAKGGNCKWRTHIETADIIADYIYTIPMLNFNVGITYNFGGKDLHSDGEDGEENHKGTFRQSRPYKRRL